MNEITFTAELVKKLRVATTTASVAVAEAALSAVCQDKCVTVRTFSTALREVAPMLGTSTQVLAAAVKAAKIDRATLDDVTAAMAAAADKKRADDRERAAKKASAKPAEDLKKAQAKVEECLLALRTPFEKAKDELTAADAAVKQAAEALRAARAARRAARAALERLTEMIEHNAETTEGEG